MKHEITEKNQEVEHLNLKLSDETSAHETQQAELKEKRLTSQNAILKLSFLKADLEQQIEEFSFSINQVCFHFYMICSIFKLYFYSS